jgi:hypothetical protein
MVPGASLYSDYGVRLLATVRSSTIHHQIFSKIILRKRLLLFCFAVVSKMRRLLVYPVSFDEHKTIQQIEKVAHFTVYNAIDIFKIQDWQKRVF